MPSRGTSGSQRGYIVPVGGAENKNGDRPIMRRFVRIAGGEEARIVIIPTASELEDKGHRYVELFEDLMVESAISLPMDERSDAFLDKNLRVLERATAVFLTGGNQLRLSTILGGTPSPRCFVG